MTDDRKLSDAKITSTQPAGSEANKDASSPQDELMNRLPGASPPSDDEAEGEGDGTLDQQ